jgi:hypothetical protein
LPQPNVLIGLDASAEVLRTRLNWRWQQNGRRRWAHSRLERLSRTDTRAVEDSMRLIHRIQGAVQSLGWKMIRHCTTESGLIAQAAERLAQEVL